MVRTGRARLWAGLGLLGLLWVLSLGFVDYSLRFGLEGFGLGALRETHLAAPGAWVSNGLMYLHMVTGAGLTVLAPVQLVPMLRRRWPRLHRGLGRVVVALALVTALAGLGFIALRGTVGGLMMDAAFAGYGLCLLVAGGMALRAARAGEFGRHRDWAARLFVLAIGSFLYRLQYALWYMATGGIASNPEFTGLFDVVTMWAFYVPYLVGVEVWLRWRRPPAPVPVGAGRDPLLRG